MNLQILISLQVVVAIVTLVIGIGYAYLIYERPFPANKTSYSVVLGTILTQVPIGIATLLVLQYYELDRLWWIILIPAVAYLITGIPQIWVERLKDTQQDQDNRRLSDGL